MSQGVDSGYGGKGVFYTWATGNGHLEGDNSNLDELGNYYAVTAACSINDSDVRASFSEHGANLWICAPSGDLLAENRGTVTTENYDRYVNGLAGTSISTAIVSGVAALMRQANPNLTWRDLKLILAASARKNDPTNAGWEDGARKYGSASATNRYHFNHEYGFGAVDAKAAVDLAKEWTNAPPLNRKTVESARLNMLIPDAPALGDPTTVTHSLTLEADIDFTEFVEVNINLRHVSFRDVKIELESPSGAVSKLTVPFDTFADDDPDTGFVPLRGEFRFGSAKHLGENPNGTWELRVTDEIPIVGGTLDSWSIKVYGHSGTPASTSTCATGGAVASASSNPGLVSDCETLLAARDTLVGTGTSLNWSAGTPISRWNGVTVEGTPARVTGVSLQDRGLRGTIPAELGDLTALTVLYLSRNQLSGCIPSALQGVAVNDLADLGLVYCDSTSVTLNSPAAGAPVRINTPIPVTATFSGPISGFAVDDVSVANGSAGNFAGADGDSVYTFDVTPNAIGTVTVDIAADAAEDAEGIGNTAAAQLSLGLPYDDNRDGKIGLPEAISAVSDYFTGVITIEQAIAVVQLYFLSGI